MFRPTKGARSVGVSSPSAFLAAMDKAFGGVPYVLNEDSGARLTAMAAVFGGDDKDNPYCELSRLIGKYGEIEVWAEY